MNINKWTPVLVALVFAIGPVQAFADSGWHYDESSDTIIFSGNSSPVTPSASSSENEVVEPAGAWYYEESSDAIVFNGEGSRDQYTRATRLSNVPADYHLAFKGVIACSLRRLVPIKHPGKVPLSSISTLCPMCTPLYPWVYLNYFGLYL